MTNYVCMTAYRRPAYTEQVIRALERCIGIEDWVLVASIEPGFPDVLDVFRSYRYDIEISVNQAVLGCTRNTKRALDSISDMTDWLVMLEDDVVPAQDFLQYMLFARQHTNLACAFRGRGSQDPDHYAGTKWEAGFNAWGWGCTADLWKRHRGHIHEHGASWDWQLAHSLQSDNECLALYPRWSRTCNIGACDGTYNPSPAWHEKHVHNPDWIGLNGPVVVMEDWAAPPEKPIMPQPPRMRRMPVVKPQWRPRYREQFRTPRRAANERQRNSDSDQDIQP